MVRLADIAVSDGDPRLAPVLRMAERAGYEEQHAHQVTRLALALFDELRALHGLGATERFRLHCAALLHDTGVSEETLDTPHNKASYKLILEADDLPFSPEETRLVALPARYHRGKPPGDDAGAMRPLSADERESTLALAAILRVADGLDRTHSNAVVEVAGEVTERQVVLTCATTGDATPEGAAALEKGDLLEQLYGRRLVVEMKTARRERARPRQEW